MERAWQAALSQDDENGLVEGIRCALIRTSFNSASRSYPPLLVAMAFAQGLWTSERVFSLAANLEVSKAVLLWATVLGTHKLTSADIVVAERLALAQAEQIRDSRERARVFVTLAGSLESKVRTLALRQGLQAARQIIGAEDQTRALTNLASICSGEEQNQALLDALATIREVERWGDRRRQSNPEANAADWERSDALKNLAPLLNADLACQALEQTKSLADGQARADAQVALISRLPNERRERVAMDIMEFVRCGLQSSFDRQRARSDRDGQEGGSRVDNYLDLLKAVAQFLTANEKHQLQPDGAKLADWL